MQSILLLLVLLRTWRVIAWIQNSEPRMITTYEEGKLERFTGNDTYIDHFKVLTSDEKTVLVGSRNIVYNISLNNLTELKEQRIEWKPSGPHRELCCLKGKSEDDCQNYIRIGVRIDEDQVLLCGTNAYKPQCRVYELNDNKPEMISERAGQGICPYDPNHNSTALYSDGQLYSATVADFSGLDPLIYRDPLRTEHSDLKLLNDPNFVSSISYGDHVLFFFREAAVEYINCGKVVYSRVARVCKRDKGGPHLFGGRWTSFIKARLNCSIPGDYPFYFNEIQSTSEIIEGVYGSEKSELIYGIFTTSANSIAGSAVCAFSLKAIMETFEGPFKEQATMNSNWLPVPHSKVPQPRPGKCVNDSRTLPDPTVNFVKSHSLMDAAVPSYSSPILVRVSLRNRFTAIAIDSQVENLSGQKMDVLFIGTDDGRIVKAVYQGSGKQPAIFVEEIQVANHNSPIKSLHISHFPNSVPKLLIVTNDEIYNIPLYRCGKINTCRECVGMQDPYCAWDSHNNACVAHNEFRGIKANFLQNIFRGAHSICQPSGHVESAVENEPLERELSSEETSVLSCPKCSVCKQIPCSNGENGDGTQEKIVIYTADTLGMVVATSVIATLVVGFLAGYFCSRHFRSENSYSNMPLRYPHQLNRLTESNINGEGGTSYLSSCANNKAAINLVVNVPPKNANDKNANTSSENNKTLQKVKKTYI